MGGLVLNPDNNHDPVVKLSDRIANEEQFHDDADLEAAPGDGEPKQKAEPKRTKFMGFSLDTKYPRTLQGFIRLLQIILLFVAMIACLLASPWQEAGAFTFYCIVTVFAALISGFLVFTVMAGNQESGGGMCGLSWIKLELLYFLVFGVLVFIGACVAASKAGGVAALSAAAAFGFLAVITFVVCIIWAWKRYKAGDEDDEKKDEDDKTDDNKSNLPPDDDPTKMQEFRINMLDENQSKADKDEKRGSLSRNASLRRGNSIDQRKYNSNPEEMRNNGRYNHSDKDSAYSEGGDFERDQAHRSLPSNKRQGSFHRRNNGSMRRVHSQQRYPQELSPRTLSNVDRNGHNRGGVPNWLQRAMESDEETIPPPQHTIPKRGEYPLLPTSEEESVAYPSVSQTLGPDGRPLQFQNHRNMHKQRGHRTMPTGHHGHRRKGHHGGHLHLPHKMQRGHGGQHRNHRGGRVHRHSRRRKGHHGNNHHGQNGNRNSNFPELHHGKPIETGSRRVIPEQPASIHFPEQSRWDEPDGMMDKYFANQR